ncbi:MAG: amidohydrolase family protein [Gemmatimonadetes bacterium]|nr:amidohydrolase family protein [Gemmatimonadota bacterium]
MSDRSPTRRDFLAAGSAAAVGTVLGATAIVAQPAAFDLVIRGGNVFDGMGNDPRELDLGIRAGRIVALQRRLGGRARDEVDARGLAVAPGFVDIHSHGDGTLAEDPRAESVIRQGITTIIVGQDGSSRGRDPGDVAVWRRTTAALKPSCNVATMVGLGSVRGAVVGDDDRPATPAELQRMVGMVRRALQEGAVGASSGLEYTPGAFASEAELIALCRPLAARGLVYATHMRNEDDRLLDSIRESIAVARGARCGLQVSHLKTQGPRNWAKLDEVFALVDEVKRAGMDIAFDRYPWIAYQTGLTNLFPVWSRDGGTEAFLKRLDDPSTGARIKQEALAKVDLIGGWDNVMVASVRDASDRAAEGKRMGQYAAARGGDPYDVTVAMLKRNAGSVGMVGFAMSEENLDRILAHPLGMVCSDGGAYAIDGPTRRGSPHPRGGGSFPRVIATYVRERKALTLRQALQKMTAFPAARVRLADRGRIATGMAADVVVFDAESVADRATYEQPFQYPVGIALVVVNGKVALRGGEREGVGAGRVLASVGGAKETT